MEDLVILVQFFQGTKFKSNGLLNILLEPKTQMRQLYDAISSGRVKTDNDALKEIAGFQGSVSLLATVRSKLKERLNDAILLVEFNDTESSFRQKAYLECLKKWAAITVLLSRNYRDLGLQRLEQLLRYTQRFEFTELTIEVLYMLRLQTGLIYGREQKYLEYDFLLRKYQETRSKEDLAETLYANLMIDFVNSKSEKREIAKKAAAYFSEISPFIESCDSYRLHVFGRLIQIEIYDNNNDYKKLIELCENAIVFFEKKPYKSYSALQIFYYSLLFGHLNLRQYKHCQTVANQYRDLFKPGTYNWYKWEELRFLAEFHATNYENALLIWSQAISRSEYNELPPAIAEAWKIFEAYLFFLICCGRLKDRIGTHKFRISRLWNEIQVSNRDKSGMNIPILIIQFLLSLVTGKYGQCIDRQESLAKYRTRYLKPDNAARSHYFFRMLEMIPKSNFDIVMIRPNTADLLEKLKSLPMNTTNQNFEVEIIPYETLWDITLSVCATRQRVVSTRSGEHARM